MKAILENQAHISRSIKVIKLKFNGKTGFAGLVT